MLTTIDGVAAVNILGAQSLSMRIWLDPLRMAAHGISASDIQAAIEDNNYQAAPGQIKGEFTVSNVHADTNLNGGGFRRLVVKGGKSPYVWKTWQRWK